MPLKKKLQHVLSGDSDPFKEDFMFCNPTAVKDGMLNVLNAHHVHASFDVPVCALEFNPSALSFTVALSLVNLLPGLALF